MASKFSGAATTHAFALAWAVAGCASAPAITCAPGEVRAVSELLYFGTARPDGVVTAEEWADFLGTSVTPRFPQGLTVWQASGQWRSGEGAIVRESTYVLSLLHPDDSHTERDVRAITSDYKSRFSQQAVLRIRTDACSSF
jgi:hypothetical protein